MAEYKEYIIFFLIWLIPTIIIRSLIKKRSSKLSPPSPLSLPIIGHLHLLAPIPHQALAKLSSKYGPLIQVRLGSYPCLVASSPDIAKDFLKTHESLFLDRPQTVTIDYLSYGSQDFSFAPYGTYWKFMKKLCMSRLLGGPTLDLLKPFRAHEIKRLVELLAKKAKNGESVDVGGELIRMTNNVVSSMIMSQRCSGDDVDEAEGVRKLVHDVAELTGRFDVSDYIWFCKNLDLQRIGKRMKEVRDRFDTMMEKIINEHQVRRSESNEEASAKDLLDILLDIAEDGSSEMKLTRENIKAFILDLFAAGTDTSAITVQWALSELINHPEIMQKAAQEIDSVIGNDERLVEESDIPNLPYLQAIVKETLRLHPTAPLIIRQSSEDCTIRGYHIPAKTRLFVNVWAIGRDPNHWENALEFMPERFISSELDLRGQHYHFLPFGSGRRGCPGISLALHVVQTTLAAMIQCFEWKIEGDHVVMEEGIGITLPMANPLICSPVIRFNPIPSV